MMPAFSTRNSTAPPLEAFTAPATSIVTVPTRGFGIRPRVGTVTMDVAAAVKASKGGAVEFRVEKAGIVQGTVGKASFDEGKLVENIKAFVDAVAKAKPTGAKGTYIQRVAISSTMGPGVKVEVASVSAPQT